MAGFGAVISSIKPYLPNVRLIWADPYFWYLKERTRGMLAPAAYRQLYELAGDLPDLPFVEVGAGAGASTIALARGVKDAGKSAPIVSIEKCEGGSRARFGAYDDNLRILKRNLSRFGVVDQVRLFAKPFRAGDADELLAAIGSSRIAGFMHDADGRLDRDFSLLWPRVVTGGLLVVDDYETPDVEALIATRPARVRKKLMIKRGLDLLIQAGMFVVERCHGSTMFGRKPDGAASSAAVFRDLKEALDTVDREVRARSATREGRAT